MNEAEIFEDGMSLISQSGHTQEGAKRKRQFGKCEVAAAAAAYLNGLFNKRVYSSERLAAAAAASVG